MALTLQSALAGGRYSVLHGRGYRELAGAGHGVFPALAAAAAAADQEAPMDLSRSAPRRSPSPDVSITTGRNALLDRAMGPPPEPEPLDEAPHDLRLVRPPHSIIPFHKLRKHAQMKLHQWCFLMEVAPRSWVQADSYFGKVAAGVWRVCTPTMAGRGPRTTRQRHKH